MIHAFRSLSVAFFLFMSTVDVCAQAGIWRLNTANGHIYFSTSNRNTRAQHAGTATLWGGRLVKIDDAAENEFVRSQLIAALPIDPSVMTRAAWIGLNDLSTEGTFLWPDGTTPGYTNWEAGEPNNTSGIEDGVEMYVTGRWNDTDVNQLRYAIIEFEPIVDPATGRRYYPIGNQCQLGVAQSIAAATGTYLMSIGDAVEAAFINASVKPVMFAMNRGDFRIGLNDATTEGVYAWYDGTPFTYTNWAVGEPNDLSGAEDSAEMWVNTPNGVWNDTRAIDLRSFALEHDPDGNFVVDQPTGSGSFRLAVTTDFGTAGISVSIVTFNTAGFGTGWFAGINPTIGEVASQYSTFSAPFFMPLDVNGDAAYSLPAGVPPGLTIVWGTVILDASTLLPFSFLDPRILTTL